MASLKKERERQGLTLKDVSERAEIDQAALSRLESGTNGNPTLDTLYCLQPSRRNALFGAGEATTSSGCPLASRPAFLF
jgi:transcriptional regulator with XRE-family HTH domain